MLWSFPVRGAGPRLGGVRELTPEQRAELEPYFPPVVFRETRAELPRRHLNLQCLPVIASQGTMEICGSFCVTYYLKTYADARQAGLTERPDPAKTPELVSSPAWGVLAFTHGDRGMNRPPFGANSQQVIRQICQTGTISWKDLPFDGDFRSGGYAAMPTVEQQTKALDHRSSSGLSLPGLDTPAGLRNLRRFLAEGGICVVGIHASRGNFSSYDGTHGTGVDRGVLYRHDGETSLAHALAIVGYDDDLEYTDSRDGQARRGAFLLANSWGQDWGVSPQEGVERGFIWIAYDLFLSGFLDSVAYGIVNPAEPRRAELAAIVRYHSNDEEGRFITHLRLGSRDIPLQFRGGVTGRAEEFRLPCGGLYNLKSNRAGDGDLDFVLDLTGLGEPPWLELALGFQNDAHSGETGQVVSVHAQRRLADGGWTLPQPLPGAWPQPVGNQASLPRTADLVLSPLQEKAQPALQDFHPIYGAALWGDFDGDGAPDLLAVATTASRPEGEENGPLDCIIGLFLFLNDGAGGLKSLKRLDDGSVQLQKGLFFDQTLSNQLVAADLDNDGDLDLVLPAVDGAPSLGVYPISLRVFRNDGKGGFALDPEPLPIPGGTGLAAADFDCDGRPDLAVANPDGIHLLRRTPAGWQAWTLLAKAAPDADPPGKEPPAAEPPEGGAPAVSRPDRLDHAVVAWGDFDGDGLPDLACQYDWDEDAQEPVAMVFFNRGPAPGGAWSFQPDSQPGRGRPSYHGLMAFPRPGVADLDNDGCDELALAGWKVRPRVWRGGPGVTRLQPCPEVLASGILGGGAIAALDHDGDGAREFAVSGRPDEDSLPGHPDPYGSQSGLPLREVAGHRLRFLRLLPGGQVESVQLRLPAASGDLGGCALLAAADADRDGDPDLLVGGCFGGAACSRRINRGPTTDTAGALLLDNLRHLRDQDGPKPAWLACDRQNSPPSAPAGLRAEDLGDGKIRFSWTADDDATPEAGLRFALRIGTAPGGNDVRSGAAPVGDAAQLVRSGFVLRLPAGTPAGTLHWSVRGIDAGLAESPWSEEATIAVPAGGCDRQALAVLPPAADGPPSFRADPPGVAEVSLQYGLLVARLASGNADRYVFSHWSGPVAEPFESRTTLTGGGEAVAHFIPLSPVPLEAFADISVHRGRFVWGEHLPGLRGEDWRFDAEGRPCYASLPEDARDLAWTPGSLYFRLGDEVRRLGDRDYRLTLQGWDENRVSYGDYTLLGFRAAGSRRALWGRRWRYSGATVFSLQDDSLVQTLDETRLAHPEGLFARVAMNDRSLLALSRAGLLYGQGANDCGQLGDGTLADSAGFTLVTPEPRFVAIALGTGPRPAAYGIDRDGVLWSWGDNARGQAGTGSAGGCSADPVRVQFPDSAGRIVAVRAGRGFALALDAENRLYAWGANESGQLGDGTRLDRAAPQPVPGLEKVTAFAAGDRHALAVAGEDGALHAWGDDSRGQVTGSPGEDVLSPRKLSFGGGCAGLSLGETPAGAVGGGILTPPPGTVLAQTGVPLPLKAADGERYVFDHWEGEGIADPGAAETTVLIPAGQAAASSVVAVWRLRKGLPYSVVLSAAASDETTAWAYDGSVEYDLRSREIPPGTTLPAPGTLSVLRDSGQELAAIPSPQYRFAGWRDDESGEILSREEVFLLRPERDLRVTALFELRPFSTTPGYCLEADGTPHWGRYFQGLKSVGGARIVRLESAGDGTAVGLGNDGFLYTAGYQPFLGRPSTYPSYDDHPGRVAAPGDDGACLGGVDLFCVCQDFAVAHVIGGGLYAWGIPPGMPGTDPDHAGWVPRPSAVPGVGLDPAAVRRMAALKKAALFLLSDGTVWSWGETLTGTGSPHLRPAPVPGLAGIVDIAANEEMALALDRDGAVWTWGGEESEEGPFGVYGGQLGLGENVEVQKTTVRIPGLPAVRAIHCGETDEFNYALTRDGTVYRWGPSYNQEQCEFNPPVYKPTETDDPFPARVDHCVLALTAPERCADLVRPRPGCLAFLPGDQVTLTASSDGNSAFSHWLVDGARVEDARLPLLMDRSRAVEACFRSVVRPELSLGDGAGHPGERVLLPLRLVSGQGPYCALDCTLTLPPGFALAGVDVARDIPAGAGTDSAEESSADVSFWRIKAPDGDEEEEGEPSRRFRFTAVDLAHPFEPGESPLARLWIDVPLSAEAGEHPVSLDGAKFLGYELGRRSEEAAGNAAVLIVSQEDAAPRLRLRFHPEDGLLPETLPDQDFARLPAWPRLRADKPVRLALWLRLPAGRSLTDASVSLSLDGPAAFPGGGSALAEQPLPGSFGDFADGWIRIADLDLAVSGPGQLTAALIAFSCKLDGESRDLASEGGPRSDGPAALELAADSPPRLKDGGPAGACAVLGGRTLRLDFTPADDDPQDAAALALSTPVLSDAAAGTLTREAEDGFVWLFTPAPGYFGVVTVSGKVSDGTWETPFSRTVTVRREVLLDVPAGWGLLGVPGLLPDNGSLAHLQQAAEENGLSLAEIWQWCSGAWRRLDGLPAYGACLVRSPRAGRIRLALDPDPDDPGGPVLRPGWNLVCLPSPRKAPESEAGAPVFTLGDGCWNAVPAGRAPGPGCVWIFCRGDAGPWKEEE